MDCLTLSPVTLDAAGFLYDLLKERDPTANISHRELPPFWKHVKFIESKPYSAWYIVLRGRENCDVLEPIGSVYLTKQDEIGIFLTKEYQGKRYGDRVLSLLMAAEPRPSYLANIAPGNLISQKFFERSGFKKIQLTYGLRPA